MNENKATVTNIGFQLIFIDLITTLISLPYYILVLISQQYSFMIRSLIILKPGRTFPIEITIYKQRKNKKERFPLYSFLLTVKMD